MSVEDYRLLENIADTLDTGYDDGEDCFWSAHVLDSGAILLSRAEVNVEGDPAGRVDWQLTVEAV